MSLNRENADESRRFAEQVQELAADDSARGPLTVIIGDWQRRILEDLASMLTIHARALQFAQAAASNADDATLSAGLSEYLRSVGTWLERTGYHDRGMIPHKPYYDPAAKAIAGLKARLGEEALLARIVQPATEAVEKSIDRKWVDPVVKAICGKQ